MNKIKKLLTKSNIIFASVMIVLLSTVFILPNVLPYKSYVILTGSMVPTIDPGDLVVMDKRINIDDLYEEEIIGFKTDIQGEDEVVFHYIYSISYDENNNLEILTHPEISDEPDDWVVHEDDLVGIYKFKIDNIGKFIYFLKSPFGIAFLFADVVIVYVVWNLLHGKKKVEVKA